MAIGGFNGTDPSPTLAQFQAVGGGGEDPLLHRPGQRRLRSAAARRSAGGSTSSEISSWVERHFTAKTVDGVTVYDLTTADGGVVPDVWTDQLREAYHSGSGSG